MVILILVAIIIAGMSNSTTLTSDDNAENLFNAVHKLEDEVDKLDKN